MSIQIALVSRSTTARREAKTLRSRLFSLAGRLTRSARRFTLHLPARWPSAMSFAATLARLRAIPLLA